jgi:hypothetical protein
MHTPSCPSPAACVLDAIVRAPADFFVPAQRGRADVPATRGPSPGARLAAALDRIAERFDRWAWEQQSRECEAYLAQSQDLADLENRLRALDRGDRY